MATDWARLTVVDLRQELKRRGLSQAGKKADLVERLAVAENGETAQRDDEVEEAATEQDASPKDTQKRDTLDLDPRAEKEPSPTPQSTAHLTEAAPEPTPAQEPLSANKENVDETLKPGIDTLIPAGEGLSDADKPDGPQEQVPSEAAPSEPVISEPDPSEPEPAGPALALAVAEDVNSRKRRSRSPTPDDNISRKRARPENEYERNADDANSPVRQPTDAMALDVAGRDISYTVINPSIPEGLPEPEPPAHAHDREVDRPLNRNSSPPMVKRDLEYSRTDQYRERSDDPMDEDDRDVGRSEHPATSALYIKNFMRPLRENVLLEYLSELAVPRNSTPDPDAIQDFFLDQIRTHAFVAFKSISAAVRARAALHGKVWPNERERRELWVDFIPPARVLEWAGRERDEGIRGTRWEVRYDVDDDGKTTARLTQADSEPSRQPSRPRPPTFAPTVPVPTGPSRPFPGVEGAPLGPRGRGNIAYRQQSFPTREGDLKETQARPPLLYQPVSEELAERRVDNMRSYYTKDRYRDLGREDEINRYTFENEDAFVDRGKEVFVGIRPPARQYEIDRRRGIERGPRGGPPPRPPAPRGGDRYFAGGRNETWQGDAPRSRLNGAPMPTFDAFRYGGGGRRGGFRGGRR